MVAETAANVADGVLGTSAGKQVIRFQRHLAHPIALPRSRVRVLG